MTMASAALERSFRLEEATIGQLHAAIRAGETTCVAVVEHYLARVRAYNGVASALVTADGAPVAPATGTVRGGTALSFPTRTVKASSLLPDLDKYHGPPLEYGRMEATASDPEVQQQFGMIVGIANAGQVNALATLNIRGERSVTCRGEFDRHPSLGPLPPGAPPVCEFFRHFPDALERAAELDAQFGSNPDLEALPMYGVVFSFKDSFDTKDMRSTGGGDAAYDIDFPARDHLLVEQLRNKGAIIFAKAVNTEYNGRAGDPGGRHKPDQGAAVHARVSAQHLGRKSIQSLRYPARGFARLELGIGALGQHQPGDGEPRRGDPRLLSRALQPQCGCVDPAAQGDAGLRRRRHRSRHLLRPQWHPRAHDRRLRQDSRCTQGSGGRLLRPARSLHHGAAFIRFEHALRRPCDVDLADAQGHAHRRDSRVHGLPERLQDRRADRHRGRERDQDDARRCARCNTGGIVRPAVAARSRARADEGGLPPRACETGAGVHARPAVPARARRSTGFQGVRRRDRADRIPARPGVRYRHDASDRLLRRAGRGQDRSALQSRSRHHPAAGAGDGVPVPHVAIPDASLLGLEGSGVHRDAGRLGGAECALEVLGRRSARCLQELGGGRRPAQPPRRPPGRQRADHAARTAAASRHDGDPGEQA